MNSLFNSLPDKVRNNLKKKKQPDWLEPMLAILSQEHFSDKDWIFERKFDGERCLIFKSGKNLRLMSRNRKNITRTYPELVDPLLRQSPHDFIMDGEIVAFEGNNTSFSRLQERINVVKPSESLVRKIGVYLYIFDVINLENKDLSELPLHYRKTLLKKALDFDHKIRFTTHRTEKGEAYLKEACNKHWEGLIAKKIDSHYVNSRSKFWLKFKCIKRQEFVIGGFTDPKGERKGFGALLIGFYDKNKLKYAGKVGTGYNDKLLVVLREKMNRIERNTSPFTGLAQERNAHWISPKLVVEIGFTEWTGSDKLRHPRFIGLRDDKKPEEVVKEVPE
jgi:bifunctional non-homologous end joining protein LigD